MTRTWTKTVPDPREHAGATWLWRSSRSDKRPVPVMTGMLRSGAALRGSVPAFFRAGNEPEHMWMHGGEWLGPITPEDVARADAFEPVTFGVETEPCITHSGVRFTGEGMIERHQQYQADAAVGRMLRETSEAWHTTVEFEMLKGSVVRVTFPAPLGCNDRTLTGPDALERAHAEVCGTGHFNLGSQGGPEKPYPEIKPAPAKPDYAYEGVVIPCPECGLVDCDDVMGKVLDAMHKKINPPPKPDYASLSDEDLADKCGLVAGGDGYRYEIEIRDPALRAALIAFLERRQLP